jgi:hypothetical protein
MGGSRRALRGFCRAKVRSGDSQNAQTIPNPAPGGYRYRYSDWRRLLIVPLRLLMLAFRR